VKRAIGLWLYISYKVQHHYLFQISLRNWLWVFVLLPPALAAIGQLWWGHALWIAAAGALLLVGIEWSHRKGYVFFEPAPINGGGEPVPIGVDEQILCRASGVFAVGGQQRHLVNAPAHLSYVQTQEHIVMVRLEQKRFLLIARSPRGEIGFWYTFFKPQEIRAVQTGHIYWGPERRASLAIDYRSTDEDPPQERTLYLTFPHLAEMERVRRHLAALPA
jgi:hypothetical protein